VYCSQKVATAVSSPRPGVPTAREAVRTSCSHDDTERNRGGVALRNGLAPDCTPMTPRGDLQRDRSSSGLDERKHKVTVVATKFWPGLAMSLSPSLPKGSLTRASSDMITAPRPVRPLPSSKRTISSKTLPAFSRLPWGLDWAPLSSSQHERRGHDGRLGSEASVLWHSPLPPPPVTSQGR